MANFERFAVVRVPFPFTDRTASKNRPALVLSAAEAFNLPYSPPFRCEALSGPVAEAFWDRARRKRSRRYGEDVRPSETPQTRGLTVPQ